MNRNLIVLILLSVFVVPVMADKPEWAGKGKPTDEQKAVHKSAMEAKGDSDDDDIRLKEKKDKSSKLKGIEKQSAKKSEQEQKELEKGSDKGKTSREENRKKWWKFWGE